MSRAEPSRELPTKLSGAEEGNGASTGGIADAKVAKTDIRKSPKIGDNFKVDLESRVEEAHVDLRLLEDEPVTPFRLLPKLEENNDPVIRQIFLSGPAGAGPT